MKAFVPVCQNLTSLTSGMLKVAERLDLPNIDDIAAFVNANPERKQLKGRCKSKGPNAALDVLFKVLQAEGLFSSDDDDDSDAMSE